MLTIKKEDFELLPSKMSIARLYIEHWSRRAKDKHITNEQIFEEIEKEHIRLFKHNLPFSSFDSFRKYLTMHRRALYQKP